MKKFLLSGLILASCGTSNLETSQTKDLGSQLRGAFEKKLLSIGCQIAEDRLREADVFACAEKISKLSDDQLKSLLEQAQTGDTPESKILQAAMAAVVEAETIVKNPNIQNKATALNSMFADYRLGRNGKPNIGNVAVEIAKRGNRYKLTYYFVALMEGGQELAKRAGRQIKPIPRDQEVKIATKLLDYVAMESCLRGTALPHFGLSEANFIERMLGEILNGDKDCQQNTYVPWDKMDSHLNQVNLDSLKWHHNQKVTLLDGGPGKFEIKKSLIEGRGDNLPQYLTWLKDSDGRYRRNYNPYIWGWMWGFYDDAIGKDYAQTLLTPPKAYIENGGRALQDVSLFTDMQLLDSDGHLETGNMLVPSSSHSKIARDYFFTSPIILGKMYDNRHFGYGMHKKGMIFDGRIFVMGGRNLGVLYSKYWHDTDVLIAGSSVAEVARMFHAEAVRTKKANSQNRFTSNNASGDESLIKPDYSDEGNGNFYNRIKAIGKDSVAYLKNDPADSKGKDSILSLHLNLIKNAKPGSTVRIANAYIILTDPLRNAIKEALAKNINFEIYTNSAASIDEPVAAMPVMLSVREMLEMSSASRAGKIKIKLRRAQYVDDRRGENASRPDLKDISEFQYVAPSAEAVAQGKLKPSTLHSKYMIVETNKGEKIVVVGSYNLHPRSSRYEEEIVAVIKSPNATEGVYGDFVRWFNAKDIIAQGNEHPQINMGDIVVTDPNAVKLMLPADWRDPRSMPAESLPQDKVFALVNAGVGLAMTIGFEQL